MAQSPLDRYYALTGDQYRMSSTRRERVLSLVDNALRTFHGSRASLLDIGIGSAEIANHCRRRYTDDDVYLVGVDLAEHLVRKYAALYDQTFVLSVEEEGWASSLERTFDVIVASELIEHLFRPDVFLSTVGSLLSKKGILILSTPNLLLWSQRVKFLLGRHRYSEFGVFEWGHIHLFSWGFLKELTERSGFDIIATNHLLHPNVLNPLHRVLPPGLFAFQFIVALRKR
ncbi:MAG: class I SAM-dependent methyltransferase [Patescibacteria group bacterium]